MVHVERIGCNGVMENTEDTIRSVHVRHNKRTCTRHINFLMLLFIEEVSTSTLRSLQPRVVYYRKTSQMNN
jgi:hypothetical protein